MPGDPLRMGTVSDHLYRPEKLTPEQRQTSMTQMIEIALDTASPQTPYRSACLRRVWETFAAFQMWEVVVK